MKVLVSGAGGFLGGHLVRCLLGNGYNVRAIIRPASTVPAWGDDVELFRADLRVHDLTSAFDGIDAVFHLAAATSGNEDMQFATSVVATERFLEAMSKSNARRLIHVSSLVVYDWSRVHGTLDESSPLLDSPYAMGGYTIAKSWQERLVRKAAEDHGWDLTVMRPGFIWGKDHAEIAGMGRHFGGIYVMFGPLSRLPLTYVENCAHCLVTVVRDVRAIGQVFNVIDSDAIRVWRYVREYSRRSKQRGIALPVPYIVGYGLASAASLTSRRLFGSKGKLPSLLTPRKYESQFKPVRFSNGKLKDLLDWKPPLDFARTLAITYE